LNNYSDAGSQRSLSCQIKKRLTYNAKNKTPLTLQKPWKRVGLMTHQNSSNEMTRVASDEPFTIHIKGKTELLIVE